MQSARLQLRKDLCTDMACSRCGSECKCACSGDPLPAQDWRRQVSLKVRAHKARKHRRLDPDSPFLEFEEQDLAAIRQHSSPIPEDLNWQWQEEESQSMETDAGSNILSSSHATFAEEDAASPAEQLNETSRSLQVEAVARPPLPPFPRIMTPVPKIIEFPRVQTRQYELAEPVADQLRIFEAVEELAPPAPNHLSSIEIAPAEPALAAIEIEVPIQAAALHHRVYAAALDLIIMMGAMGLFAVCAQLFVSSLPQTKPLLASVAVCGLLLLAIYYYLSFSLHRSTVGIDAAGLSVVNFSGQTPSRLVLRCRALATVLSYAALGMGLAWSLIDEDRLCWHDRITHTYLVAK